MSLSRSAWLLLLKYGRAIPEMFILPFVKIIYTYNARFSCIINSYIVTKISLNLHILYLVLHVLAYNAESITSSVNS